MLIEIKTKAVPYENGFALYRTEYLDGVKMETDKDFYIVPTQFEADLINLGLSLKYIIEFDNKFGVEVVSGFKEKHSDKDYKQLSFRECYRKYINSDERCPAVVITENVELFENFFYSIRYYENLIIRKMLLRVVKLQKESFIEIKLPSDIFESWQQDAKLKYA